MDFSHFGNSSVHEVLTSHIEGVGESVYFLVSLQRLIHMFLDRAYVPINTPFIVFFPVSHRRILRSFIRFFLNLTYLLFV